MVFTYKVNNCIKMRWHMRRIRKRRKGEGGEGGGEEEEKEEEERRSNLFSPRI